MCTDWAQALPERLLDIGVGCYRVIPGLSFPGRLLNVT
jgi:hypothetical protein